MNQALVFVPCSRDEAARIARGEALMGCLGHTVTPELLDALELGRSDDEESERGCLLIASVAALAAHGERLVLVAQVPAAQLQPGEELHNGQVRIGSLSPAGVQSFFLDNDPQPLLAAAASAAKDLSIDEAWELDEVQALLARADLLWHSVEELALIGKDV